jgi:peptide/nickel transport system permease protein
VGLVLVGMIVGVAIVGPVVFPASPFASSGIPLQSPVPSHWLGTDDLGRDTLAGVIQGARVSMLVGLMTGLAAALFGTVVGACAGYFGGWVDDSLMRLTEAVQTLPRFFLAVVIAALFGPSIVNLTVLLALTFWTGTARLLRAQVLSIRERDYVLAARSVGASSFHVLARHILPNSISVVLISAALQLGAAILVEASLSFLGLGDRSQMSWGYMLNNAQPFLRIAWWMSVFPGAALALAVLGVNLLSDALQHGSRLSSR